MVLMRVSELAQRSGVAATTLRYYEQRGLLPAQRSHGSSWILPLDKAGRLAELAAAEQQCCAFLDLRIDFTPPTGAPARERPPPPPPRPRHTGRAGRTPAGCPGPGPVKEN